MAARAAAAQAARRHLAASAIGFAAAVAVAKAFMVPQQSLSEVEADAGEGKRELQLVQVVFRHGARTPLGQKYWPELGPKWDVCGKAYDAVPIHVTTEDGRPRPVNLDDQKQVEQRYEGGCSKGELTLVGQQQALEFGRWLRWRYAMVHALLPHAHQEGAVVARTTNYSRTVATLQGVLTGLHPGTAAPIPVHTTEEIDEILYTNVKSCKRLHTLMQQLHRQQRDAAEQGGDPGVEAVQQRVRSALGLPPDHRVSFVDLHDAMTSMQTHGKAIPEGMRDEQLLREVDRLATQRFMHVVAPPPNTGKTQEVLRLGMGVLMETMVRRMEAAAAGAGASGAGPSPAAGTPTSAASSSGAGDAASGSTSSSGDDGAGRAEGSTDSGTGGTGGGTAPRMYLYSGHDSSLMPLLAALGQPVQDWPPYLSSLALELWRQPSGKHYVKVLYNRKELPLTQLCGTPACELQTFREKVIGPYLLTRDQHKQECLLHFMHDQPAGEHTETEEVSVGSSFQEEADSGRQGGKGDHGNSNERSQGDQEKKTEPPRAAAEGG